MNYHRAFIKNYAQLAVPLYRLTGKNKFRWEQEHQDAFASINEALVSAPVLALPNKIDPFILDTDASDTALGAEILQIQNGEEKVIAYGSTSLWPNRELLYDQERIVGRGKIHASVSALLAGSTVRSPDRS